MAKDKRKKIVLRRKISIRRLKKALKETDERCKKLDEARKLPKGFMDLQITI